MPVWNSAMPSEQIQLLSVEQGCLSGVEVEIKKQHGHARLVLMCC